MRWFVALILVCGCHAGGAGAGDAAPVDAALDGDGAPVDAALDGDGAAADSPEDASAADGDGSALDSSVDATASGCALLGRNCPAGTNCYPFPFNEMAASPQCASHVECPGGSICSTLFSLGTDCRPLCDVAGAACPQGMECLPLAGYAREGICL
jgi:hypothetical protein